MLLEGAEAGKACRKLLRAYVREFAVTGKEGAKAEVLRRIRESEDEEE